MFTPQSFHSSFLDRHERGISIRRVLAAALNAVEPGAAVRRYLRGNPIPKASRVFGFGLGKAAGAMMQALAEETDLYRALIITKHAPSLDIGPVIVLQGDHPVPGESSLSAGRAALKFVS
ncbi:MAG: DUF4147 domain-containing protein, partial [Anaerolineales bacterium]|nr:DUF4147 domain-containing protein [Anaerolineales bacterium]